MEDKFKYIASKIILDAKIERYIKGSQTLCNKLDPVKKGSNNVNLSFIAGVIPAYNMYFITNLN